MARVVAIAPSVRDRTIVLPESEIGVKINLSVLGGSGYDALIVRDEIADPAADVVEKVEKAAA